MFKKIYLTRQLQYLTDEEVDLAHMDRIFQLIKRKKAQAGLPQSELRKLLAAVHRGASIVLEHQFCPLRPAYGVLILTIHAYIRSILLCQISLVI